MNDNPDIGRPQEMIIRRLSPPHCARGPKACPECKEAAKRKEICLLRIFFDPGQITRPVIELERDGDRSFLEYDVIRRFSLEEEAIEYAKANGIEDITLD